MSKESLYKLCDELRIYLEKQKTQFRDPISVEKQATCTLYIYQMKGDYVKQQIILNYTRYNGNTFRYTTL